MSFIYNLTQGIRNIIYWLPVIWRDRNWDYSYFLEILRHKLYAIRLDIPNWTRAEKEKDEENIEYVISLIDAVVNDEYEKQAFDKHRQHWGSPKVVFESIDDKFSEMTFVYPEASSQAEAGEQLSRLLREAMRKRQEAINILFGIIRDSFETWWI